MKFDHSSALFEEAKSLIPGGVNSPVRAFKAVGMNPLFIREAHGSKVIDVDGNEYIDYIGSWGPLILGHSHPAVVKAVQEAAAAGTSYGAPCPAEIDLARMIVSAFPSIEKVRMVSSGTEATMSAVRLARAYTGRSKIIKFEGCYHGHGDSFLIKAGSGLLTAGVPSSPGVPRELAELTLIAAYNDLESVQRLLDEHGSQVAAIIVEPIAGNMGLVLPEPGFLQGLRDLTREYGALLIFDEVISGFRLCFGGYQNIVDIKPDLTTLGKIIGGGLPVGAYGGRREIMERIAPEGDVYQAGTLSGNPLAMAAGLATLKILFDDPPYGRLDEWGRTITDSIAANLSQRDCSFAINRIGSMFSLFFTGRKVKAFEDVMSCDTELYARFYRALIRGGVYFPPSQFEVCFVSQAHSKNDLEETVQALDRATDSVL
ncbi:MAG: glutamate-1-semialdehyde 2,1-aminomutase [Syntrophomonadaceae bacterium]